MVTTVRELIEQEFGVHTTERENPENQTVDATAVLLFRNNPRRLGFLVINLSANTLYIAPRPDVSSTLSIALQPNGGSITMVYKEDFTVPTREWYCIGSGVGTDFYSMEILLL